MTEDQKQQIAWGSADHAVELIKKSNTKNRTLFSIWEKASEVPQTGPADAEYAEAAAITYKWMLTDGATEHIVMLWNLAWHCLQDFTEEKNTAHTMCVLWDLYENATDEKQENAILRAIEEQTEAAQAEAEVAELELKLRVAKANARYKRDTADAVRKSIKKNAEKTKEQNEK